ncbi:MAG TPA: hypothetical protein VHA73_05345 [Acidimicrobiales bacterium]|jgi:hypothetical protein|nr:hypothetical protein [Acidimicrobiales bacterium]
MFGVLAGGFTDLINGKINQWQGLARGGITLLSMVVVGVVFVTKRALMPVLGAVLLSAIVLWAVWNTDWLRNKTTEEFNQGLRTPIVQVAPRTIGLVPLRFGVER